MKSKLYLFFLLINLVFAFSACQKELSFENGNLPGTISGSAEFTFAGTSGNCATPIITGSYDVGTTLDASNKLTLQVNVSDTGTYSITSTNVNGISFSANGVFLTTGLQNIIFTGSGTPAAPGTFSFLTGTSGCSFSITCAGTTTPPGSTSNCKSCTYTPMCKGNKFSYNDTTYGVTSIRSNEILNILDTTIDGKLFQKLITDGGNSYFNCTNGESAVVGFDILTSGGNVVQKYESIMLKANAAVGTKWKTSLTNPQGQTVIQNFKIEAKGVSRSLGGFNFPDVIVVSLETGMDLPPIGYISAGISYYYYAKGVGLVEMISIDPTSGDVFYHSVVKSYFIP